VEWDLLKFEPGDIGVRLLESITRGLYDGNLNCIREYVQNGIDCKADKIEIYLENGIENLVIKDDAKGMTKEELRDALRLGWSSKTEDDVGWRGIGIWSGISVCKRMAIITKAKGSEKYLIEINCDKLLEEMDKNKDVFEVLSAVTGEIKTLMLGREESLANDHYTIIRLERILPQLRTVFTKDDIQRYLEDNIPAPFNPNFMEGKEINNYLKKNGVELQKTEIMFQNEKIFRPPRKAISSFDEIIKHKFVLNGEEIAVAWFVTTKNNQLISDEIGGVIFKKKGFTIGNTSFVVKQCKTSYNKWQVGEIHIVSKNFRENAPRNNFESADNLEDFLREVGAYIGKLGAQNRYQSETVVTKYVEKAQKLAEQGKLDDAEQEIKKANDRLKRKRSFPDEPSLAIMKKPIDEQSKSDKKVLDSLKKQIKSEKDARADTTDELAGAKNLFNSYKRGMDIDLQNYERKFSSHGKLDFDISITRPLIDLLQQRTGLSTNELKDLSNAAYGWTAINASIKDPILTVDPLLNDRSLNSYELNKAQNRNREFGVMVYAIHDLLVNVKKHKQGYPTLEWFETASDAEKYKMLLEIYATLNFILRLIKLSEPYQP
jgi:hypothetical protein